MKLFTTAILTDNEGKKKKVTWDEYAEKVSKRQCPTCDNYLPYKNNHIFCPKCHFEITYKEYKQILDAQTPFDDEED